MTSQEQKLFGASCVGNLGLVKELLSQGVNPNIIGSPDQTPLWYSPVRVLVTGPIGGVGIDPNIVDKYSCTHLSVASENGHLEIVKELLLNGADPNIADIDNQTPLYWASSGGHLEIVKELLLNGADPNIGDDANQTPLFQGSVYGNLEIVKELLLHGADPNIADNYDTTPLSQASTRGHSEIVTLLENYLASLHSLSLISIIKYKINITTLPSMLYSS